MNNWMNELHMRIRGLTDGQIKGYIVEGTRTNEHIKAEDYS